MPIFRSSRTRAASLLATFLLIVAGSGTARAKRYVWPMPQGQRRLVDPWTIAWDPTGDEPSLLVGEQGRILRLALDGQWTEVAGTGEPGLNPDHREPGRRALDARLGTVAGMVVMPDGSIVFTDFDNHLIRQVLADGTIRTVAGTGAPGDEDGLVTEAEFDHPCALALMPDGTLLVFDSANYSLRAFRLEGKVETLIGPPEVEFGNSCGLAVSSRGRIVVGDAERSRLVELALDDKKAMTARTIYAQAEPEGADIFQNTYLCDQYAVLAFAADDQLVFNHLYTIDTWIESKGAVSLVGLDDQDPTASLDWIRFQDRVLPASWSSVGVVRCLTAVPGGGRSARGCVRVQG